MTLLTILQNNLSDPYQIARGLVAAGRHAAERSDMQIAVVIAHAGCDVETRWALERLVEAKCAPLAAVLVPDRISLTLTRDDTYGAYQWLTGDPIRSFQKLWQPYAESRLLRHQVAHAGASVSPEQAEDCLKSAIAYIEHVEQATVAALKTNLT